MKCLPILLILFFSCKKELPDTEPVNLKVSASSKIRFSNILILGNSITFHPADKELGWNLNCGMAATRPENDYVHLLRAALKQADTAITVNAVNISKFENEYRAYDFEKELSPYKALQPDLIIFRIGENLNSEQLDEQILKEKYRQLLNYFWDGNRHVNMISTGSFWANEKADNIIRAATVEAGGIFISFQGLDQDISNTAWGKFANPAVASHPSDKGMARIANLILKGILQSGN